MDTKHIAAKYFAIGRHGHQKRANGKPYYGHLNNVAAWVATFQGSDDMIAAAWLHDVIEDTATDLEEILKFFGDNVCGLVDELTDKNPPRPGVNRRTRKQRELERLATASQNAQLIKLADIIDNLEQSDDLDPVFRKIYLKELGDLIEVLTKAPPNLQKLARNTHQNRLLNSEETKT